MTTNASMTLYHKRYDENKGYDVWDRYQIENVMWQGGKGASVDKGYDKANDIKVWIPYNGNENLENITFSIGDIIVKDIINDKISKQSDIKEDSFNITTAVNNNYGDYDMKHWYLGAK